MSLRSRASNVWQAILGREQRNIPVAFESLFATGLPSNFKPQESLEAYGDNPWLGAAVDKIAHEVARTKFFLQKVNAKGEIEVVRKHQAIETLNKPQPIKGGKSLLSGMDLKLVTAYHLCLNGEAFWVLDKRLKMNGAPTSIDLLLPQYVKTRVVNGELVEYVYELPERTMRFTRTGIGVAQPSNTACLDGKLGNSRSRPLRAQPESTRSAKAKCQRTQ